MNPDSNIGKLIKEVETQYGPSEYNKWELKQYFRNKYIQNIQLTFKKKTELYFNLDITNNQYKYNENNYCNIECRKNNVGEEYEVATQHREWKEGKNNGTEYNSYFGDKSSNKVFINFGKHTNDDYYFTIVDNGKEVCMINKYGIYDKTGKKEKKINSLDEISGIEKYYDLINNFHNEIKEKDLANNEIKTTLKKYIGENEPIIDDEDSEDKNRRSLQSYIQKKTIERLNLNTKFNLSKKIKQTVIEADDDDIIPIENIDIANRLAAKSPSILSRLNGSKKETTHSR